MNRFLIAVSLSLCALCGCINLDPQPDTTRYFVLGAGNDAAGGTQVVPSDGLSVGLRRITLAPHLNIPQLIVRQGPNEVGYVEGAQWGEDLELGIGHVLADYLTQTSSIGTVDLAPWPVGATHDMILEVQVQGFEAALPNAVLLRATWVVRDPRHNTVIRRGRTNRRKTDWTPGDFGGLVQELDTLLKEFAQDLEQELGAIQTEARP